MDRRSFLAGAAAFAPALSLSGPAAAQARRFDAADFYSAQAGATAFLVMRNGVILHETYLAPGGVEIAYPLGGVSKVLASVLATALVRDDLLLLDEPVSFTIGDWGVDPLKSGITIRHLLSLTCGIASGRQGAQAPTLAEAIGAPVRAQPGQAFFYDDAPYTVFSEIVARKLLADGREPDAADFLDRRVLAQLGARADWARASEGTLWLGSGAAMTARGLAQVGELVRRQGIWRARRTLSRIALEESFQGSFASPRFGLGWWLADALPPTDPFVTQVSDIWALDQGIPRDLVMGAGAAGQRLYVIPSLAMVVVRLTEGLSPAPPEIWSDVQVLRALLADV